MRKYSRIRSRDDYVKEKLSTKSQSTMNIFNVAINSLDKLCTEKFEVENFDVVITDVLKMELEEREDEIADIIQMWINKSSKTKVFNTIKME